METGVNEYPMMAGLVDPFLKDVFCGATIISVKYVLTAAHCLTDRNTNSVGVLVGDHDLSTGKHVFLHIKILENLFQKPIFLNEHNFFSFSHLSKVQIKYSRN